MEERVRIVDIADELGLSTATVSNVIHGKTKKISDETVRRVQELLEKRQYIPSMAGILLSQNNSRIIGVVVNNHEKYENKVLEDAFIASALNALLFELEKSGYFMMVKATADCSDIIRYASMWNMDGLVLIGFCKSDYEELRNKMHIPFVVYEGFFGDNSRICNLTIDNYDGGYQAGTYLYELGHRRVLCIADNNICMDKERMDGCAAGMHAKSGKTQVCLMQVPMKKEERLFFYEKHFEEMMTYTAAFVASDVYAIELMHFLTERGAAIPKDISLVGFDNISLCENVCPRLTTVGQSPEKRAELAVQALKKLKAGEPVDNIQVLPVKLIIRESTSAPRQERGKGYGK